ncbi:MAG: DUF4395 domain-containing protein [Actinomycetota bacterium]
MIDPRGPRFAAGIASVVLAAVLLTGSAWLLTAQVAVFATTAAFGAGASPYGRLYALAVRPRIGPPARMEDERPPRFAQGVGFAFGAVGLAGLLAGVSAVFYVAVGLALAAAFLNAAFGFCLGCELYLLTRRITTRNTEVITP